jgi:hypothetical protein
VANSGRGGFEMRIRPEIETCLAKPLKSKSVGPFEGLPRSYFAITKVEL